jgi:hypothetical protein
MVEEIAELRLEIDKIKKELAEIKSESKPKPKLSRRIVAQLSMPGIGSWDGRWTGSGARHTVLVGRTKKDELLIGVYSYDFGDGWVARVTIRRAELREKLTGTFWGYDWMIQSIKKHKKIKPDSIVKPRT